MHGKLFECLILQLVLPNEALLIPSPPRFNGLRDDVKMLCDNTTILPKVIKGIALMNSVYSIFD